MEGALILELNRLEQLRTAPREQYHQPKEHTTKHGQGHREPPVSTQRPIVTPSFTSGGAHPKFERLPFGLRHLYTSWWCEKATERCKAATKECERAAGRNIDYTDASSSTSSI
ncbi:hypothetical protein QAD02_001498 [Eretmocerus hayati]|uniref:Uncharacterized protein n=1 Tax=Eretmocerus hayati TaxID=131215 RepID=A0ACC2NG72_9HYME|nr:hypothetical protein QAD02_001498 [Eretmocerus hayati]